MASGEKRVMSFFKAVATGKVTKLGQMALSPEVLGEHKLEPMGQENKHTDSTREMAQQLQVCNAYVEDPS